MYRDKNGYYLLIEGTIQQGALLISKRARADLGSLSPAEAGSSVLAGELKDHFLLQLHLHWLVPAWAGEGKPRQGPAGEKNMLSFLGTPYNFCTV